MTYLIDSPAHRPAALMGHSHALPIIHPKINTASLGLRCLAENPSDLAANPCWPIDHPSHRAIVLQSGEQASRRVPCGNTGSQGECLPLTPHGTTVEGSR
jgi:hypothetical protein